METPNRRVHSAALYYCHVMRNVSSDKGGQQRPRSACAYAQTDQDLCCSLTKSLDTTEYMNGEQWPG